jgi:hypothetical protein
MPKKYSVAKVNAVIFAALINYREVSEWLKEHAWKVCIPQGIEGSNPFLSAEKPSHCNCGDFFMYLCFLIPYLKDKTINSNGEIQVVASKN